tara:strand:+ start:9518 stop:9766 length:249 start_codon:yes stop_codon:yes gene_type:complete
MSITLQDLQHNHIEITCVKQTAWGLLYGFIEVYLIDHSKENKEAKHRIYCTLEEARKAIKKSEVWVKHAYEVKATGRSIPCL